MSDLLRSFLSSVRARTKRARKACGNLWGQMTIFKTILGNCLQFRKVTRHYNIYTYACRRTHTHINVHVYVYVYVHVYVYIQGRRECGCNGVTRHTSPQKKK